MSGFMVRARPEFNHDEGRHSCRGGRRHSNRSGLSRFHSSGQQCDAEETAERDTGRNELKLARS
jgi:hypothetical protein